MKKFFLPVWAMVIFWSIGSVSDLKAQQGDSLVEQSVIYRPQNNKEFFKRSILPLSMIASGFAVNYISGPLGKTELQNSIHSGLNDFHTSFDDYIQYAPIGGMYLLDILGVNTRNNAFDQTKYLLISELGTSLVVHGMKNSFKNLRPDGSSRTSFPSGHTSQAFVAATVLHHEIKDTSPWISVGGYLCAATTGVLRVMNNKHYVSDVLVGAGIAVLVTNTVYFFEPLKDFNPFQRRNKDKGDLSLYPSFYDSKPGFTLLIRPR